MASEGNKTHNKSSSNDVANLRGSLEQVKIIGSGGMSQIFRAHQPSLDRFVVIKKLKEELLGNEEAKERFRREAKALASVLHQNIAHVYDFVEATRESYILMEHIDGIDLSVVIDKVGHLPPQIAASILLGIARGVKYIHSHNLIHRDIKPSNIRLTTRGEVKLMDFGIVMDTDDNSLTRPGMMVGSPNYLSPEQVLGDPLSSQSDIFLLGICLYEMLTGTRPFKEERGETVFQRIREGKFIPVRSMQSMVPKGLEKIAHRCLEKNLNKRYPSAKAVIFDLECFLGPLGSTHTEDTLLKFLDEEALVNTSVPWIEVQEEFRPIQLKKVVWPMVIVLIGVVLGALWGAYYLGKEEGVSKSLEIRERYGAPKKLKKH